MNAIRSALASIWFGVSMALLPFAMVTLVNRRWAWWAVRAIMSVFQFGISWFGGIHHKIVDHSETIDSAKIDTPILYVVKHQSLWETMAFSIYRPNAVVIQKQELIDLPFFGTIAKRTGMIGVRRNEGMSAMRKLLRDCRIAVKEGYDLAIYPEGTRVAPGLPISMHPGAFAIYRDLGMTVIPVAHQSGLFWRKGLFNKRPGCITMEFLAPIAPGLDRKSFERAVAQAIDAAVLRLEASVQA